MKRRLLNLLTALSLLLCVASAALWAGLRTEGWSVQHPRDPYDAYYTLFGSRVGGDDSTWGLVQTLAPPLALLLPLVPLHLASRQPPASDRDARRRALLRLAAAVLCGAVFVADVNNLLVYLPSGRGATRAENVGTALTSVVSPVLGLVFLTAAVRGFSRLYARRRGGLCLRCGYDLRATPGRCPECGAGSSVIAGG